MTRLFTSCLVLSSLIVIVLTGCHSQVLENWRAQTVRVAVVDETSLDMLPSVKCSLTGTDDSSYHLRQNPGWITIPTDSDNHHLYMDCQAPNYYQAQIAISKSLDQWTYQDLTILPGNIIEQDRFPPPVYPEQIIVFMKRNPLPSESEADRQFMGTQQQDRFFQGR